jgi:hypothetical protein
LLGMDNYSPSFASSVEAYKQRAWHVMSRANETPKWVRYSPNGLLPVMEFESGDQAGRTSEANFWRSMRR